MRKALYLSYLIFFSITVISAQPNSASINSAISSANSLVGQKSFPLSNGVGYSPSFFACSIFVANAYGWPAASYYAYELWDISEKHKEDLNAPRGSLVFWDKDESNFGAGHVALSIGNGEIIEAGYDVIIKSKITDENYNAKYLGWAWPRSIWPGRSSSNTIKGNLFFIIPIVVLFLAGGAVMFWRLSIYKRREVIERT